MTIQIPSIAEAATLKDTVNAIQTTPAGLPNVANPRGNFGNLLSELFWGVGDGTKNGKIKPQYLDYSGISTWTTTGSNAYYGGTGGVGIGISGPYSGAKLHVLNGVSAAGSYNTNRDDFIVENGSGPAGLTVMSAINNPAGIELRSGGGISFIAAFTNPAVNSDTSFSVQ